MPGDPFRTDDLPYTPLSRAALRVARPLLERALQIDSLRAAYEHARCLRSGSFPTRALRVLDITTALQGDGLRHIPRQGPVVIVANHPHGALDGLVLAAALESVRPDVRLLANYMLQRVPEMRDLCYFVDPFGGPESAARSRAGLRAAHLWLRHGGALIAFPAGEVAHMTGRGGAGARRKPGATIPIDSPWIETIGRLAIANGATVVPTFIEGGNSRAFYAAGRVHPALRTVMLPSELMRQRGRTIRVSIGAPIALSPTSAPVTAADLVTRARGAVEALGANCAQGLPSNHAHGDLAHSLSSEIDALPSSARLVDSDGFQVYCAKATDIPLTLREIGRLRELTYRVVGEGTGQDCDIDRFDDDYVHLFVWDRKARRLVGAYRIGDIQAIVSERGVNGLYTRQLFRYDERFLQKMGPALELGRSWVRSEYQKNYNALLLLWRGIGRFVVERSEARVLFGPVSISARYSDASHTLLMAFLAQNHLDRPLAELVEAIHPRTPQSAPQGTGTVLPRSIDEANALVTRLEADGKGVPVLLRQYLKLNARLIGFNVDPGFGDALDALMMVDLTAVQPSILNRYLGKEAASAFLTRHRSNVAA